MTIFGPDISNNNGVVNIDRVVDEGYQFLFAKVSEGTSFQDKLWRGTRDWCARRGLLCVGYHYVKTDGSPAQQAWNFQDNGGGDKVMFDFEVGSGNINNYWACVDAFNAIGIQVVLTYLPAWYWGQIGKPDLSNVRGLLIASNYRPYSDDVAYIDQYGYHGWVAYGGRTPDLWQYTDAQPIAGLSLDCNAFRGTRDELAGLLGMGSALLIPGVEGLPA